ncbi:MAG TPA: multiheme c-type cytochrome [Blastocatellia bacterium]|nr:multiheme c-type cytochrome [Blastocatellia bacterium]
MARRVNYTNAFKEKFKDIPSLLVDTGHFLADERNTHGELRFDAVIRSDRVLRAYDQFPVDVANVSAYDAPYISRWSSTGEAAGRPNPYPMLRRVVSANIVGEAKSAGAPFVVREIVERSNARRGKPTRVAFIGLSSPEATLPPGLRLIDPVEAAKRVVPEAKKQADVVIVLAHLQTDPLVRIAREVTGIDAIINGSGDIFKAPMRLGATFVAFTPFEMRTIGELRFYRDAQGRLSVWDRYISLDDEVGDDPESLKVVEEARGAETGARAGSRQLLESWLAQTRALTMGLKARPGSEQPPAAGFVSSGACAQCHAKEYAVWANSGHTRASDHLVIKKHEFEVSCLACHATGLQKAESTAPADLAKIQNVGCEQCHGPGADHVARPAKGYGRIPAAQGLCSACHTPQTSPAFDLKTAWEKIKH